MSTFSNSGGELNKGGSFGSKGRANNFSHFSNNFRSSSLLLLLLLLTELFVIVVPPLQFNIGGGGGGIFGFGGCGGAGGALFIGGGGGGGALFVGRGGGGGTFAFLGGNIWNFGGDDAFMDSFWPPTDFRLSGDLFDENLLRLKFSLLLPPKAQTGSLKQNKQD